MIYLTTPKTTLAKLLLPVAPMTALLAAAVVLLEAPPLQGQYDKSKLEFEVASIKAVARDSAVKPHFFPGTRINWSGSTLTLENYSVKDLIRDAYNLRDEQIVGANGLESQRYLIVAKAPPHTTENEARLMSQTLLADRFKFQSHRETRDFPAYALVVDKDGPKLIKAKERATNTDAVVFRIGRGHISQPLTMAELARMLTTRLGRPVSDMTSLKGEFDITLDWTPDESEHDPFAGLPPKPRPIDDSSQPAPERPSIFTAIQQQLGLKLEIRKKTPVEVLIIDHVERPSEN